MSDITLEELHHQIADEIIRLCQLTLSDKLSWKAVQNCGFILLTSHAESGTTIPRCVVNCCESTYNIMINGITVNVPSELVKMLCQVIREQIDNQKKQSALDQFAATLQLIK